MLHSVEVPRTSNQPDRETSAWRHTISMPMTGSEPAIPASERPQTHSLDCAATGTGYTRRTEDSIVRQENIRMEFGVNPKFIMVEIVWRILVGSIFKRFTGIRYVYLQDIKLQWRWRQSVSPKQWCTFIRPQTITFHNLSSRNPGMSDAWRLF